VVAVVAAVAVVAPTTSPSTRCAAARQGYNSGIKIIVATINALKASVIIIQYLDLVLIFPLDSIIESSNIICSLFTVKKSYVS
jgi:hypothetical protein